MSYSQYFLHSFMDMGSLFGTILRSILNYKTDLYVLSYGFLNNKANIDNSSRGSA